MLELAATATRTWIVAFGLGKGLFQLLFLAGQDLHDLGWSAISPQKVGHQPHWAVNVIKKSSVPGTEIIQTGLTGRGLNKTILGAPPVAHKTDLTLPAVTRQGIAFVLAKFALLVRSDQFNHGCIFDIAQKIIGLHKVITGIQVASVLHGQGVAAGRGKDTQGGWRADPRGQRHVKNLDKYLAHIPPDPFVKDRDQKTTVLFGRDGSICHRIAFLKTGVVVTFDNSDELDELGVQLIPEETIHLQGMISIGRVDGR